MNTELSLRAEDAAGRDLVGLAEKLDEHGRAIDVAGAPKARLALLEAGLLQIVLERVIRLGPLVSERKSDDEIDICRADMGRRSVGKPSDQVSRSQSPDEVDALPR